MTSQTHKTIGAVAGTGLALVALTALFWGTTSRPLSLRAADPMPARTSGVFAVDAVADFAALDTNDNDVVIWADAADGGLFVYDASSTAVADAYSVIDGPGSVGRYLRFATSFGMPTADTAMGNQAGAVTVDWSTASIISMTMTADVDFSGGFTDASTARWLTLVLTQDGTGGWTVTWPTIVGAAPVIDGTAGATTVVQIFFDGTNYYTF